MRSDLAKKEAQERKPLSETEIDQFIDFAYGADTLDGFKQKALQTITQYEGYESETLKDIASLIRNDRTKWAITKIGAWRGFCGNVLTAMVVLIIAIAYHVVEDNHKAKHAVEYYNRCLASVFAN